ncbi:HutD family protein [Pigmentiphaga aceris]|uniref:HutD family protein n=1 Tax=Pigmentiphaga aceris TaxID=1940612 RepID=A0A5C0ASZ6_9BURK|nr:HutD family protein [Pigmentiphaga aceris]QEI04754.1 HutD family protein [Pigmentiphaga aceris]
MSAVRVGWLHELPAEPWKNGGGTTRTLAQGGPDAQGKPGWRVSLADIARDGAYSSFVGQQRHSLILNGEGVDLADGDTQLALRRHQPVAYAGAPAWDATLVDGPVRALNVMVDETRFGASIESVVESVTSAQQVSASEVRLIVAFNQEGQLDAADTSLRLHAGEFAVDTTAIEPFLLAQAGTAQAGTLALIRIWPLADTAPGLASPRKTDS